MLLTLTLETFDELMPKAQYAIVLFTSPWDTNSTQSIAVIGDDQNQLEFIKNNPGASFLGGQVNIETERELVDRYSIREMPTILGFKNGVIINKTTDQVTDYESAFGKLLGLSMGHF